MADVRENSSSVINFVLKQADESPLPKASLLTLKLKLYNVATGAVINSRDNVDILDVNGGTVNADGTGTLSLAAADNPVNDASLAPGHVEEHAAVIKFTATSNVAGSGVHTFTVEKIA